MAGELYLLNSSDVEKLRKLLDNAERIVQNVQGRPDTSGQFVDHLPPELYQAKVPSGGLDETSSLSAPESAYCDLYRLVGQTGGSPEIAPLNREVRVFNPYGAAAVAADTFVTVARDKFGTWWAVGPASATSSGGGSDQTGDNTLTDSAGFTQICAVQDGTGGVTGFKIRRQYGNMFRCEDVDECCLPAYWCVRNSQQSITTSCCSPATFTRVLRFAITSKTGDATDLPDLVHMVQTASGSTTWSTGGAEQWGTFSSNSTFTISCDDETGTGTTVVLEGELTLSFASGGNRVTLPCNLTQTGVSLGTFSLTGTRTNACGETVSYDGTFAVAVSSWEDGAGDAVTGVVEFGENEVPPWDADGPFKTEAEAEACCPVQLSCSGQTIEIPQVLYVDLYDVVAAGSTTGVPFTDYSQGLLDTTFTFRNIGGGTYPNYWRGEGHEPSTAAICEASAGGALTVPLPRTGTFTQTFSCHGMLIILECGIGSTAYKSVNWNASDPGGSSTHLLLTFRFKWHNNLGVAAVPQLEIDASSFGPTGEYKFRKPLPTGTFTQPDDTGLVDIPVTIYTGLSFPYNGQWTGKLRIRW